jgi:mono/diheme cytochrome c family protein
MKLRLIFFNFLILLCFTNLKGDEMFNMGKEVFLNNGNCAACHSLKDAGSVANIGPNLNEIRPVLERVKNAVTNGIGVMPAYQGILSNEEINAVSYYVSKSANN